MCNAVLVDAMPDKQTILAIGAHAADVELTAGAALMKHIAAGWEAHIAHISLGEKGHPTLGVDAYAQQKRVEAEKAAQLIGARAHFLPFRDGEIELTWDIVEALVGVIREVKPCVVVTHWRESIHPDHTATYHLTRKALFVAGNPHFSLHGPAHSVSGIYFAENWEDPDEFEPYVYVDVSDVMKGWECAVKSYELVRGDVVDYPYWDYYSSLTRMRGIQIGVDHAQAFNVDTLRKRHITNLL